MPMPGCKRTPTARGLIPLTRVLGLAGGVAVLALSVGCSSAVTRFKLLGSDFFGAEDPPARPAPNPVAYGPRGYVPSGNASPGRGSYLGNYQGNGLQETALPPLASPGQDYYRPPGRDYPPGAAAPNPPPRPEPVARMPNRGAPPWTDRSPPWTDKDPFPWPEN